METNRKKIEKRLKKEGWIVRHGGSHDFYKHPLKKGIITLPRHKIISKGVANTIHKAARW